MKKTWVYIYMVLMLTAPLFHNQAYAGLFRPEKKYFSLAEKEYAAKQYLYAIPLYKASIKRGNQESIPLLRLADCYWQIRNIDSALLYFKSYEAKSGGITDSKLQFRFAELLAQNGEYEYAVKILSKTGGNAQVLNDKLVQARKEGFLHPEKFKEDSQRVHIQYLNINSLQSDYSPRYYKQGIVYISNRVTKDRTTREIGWNGKTYSRLYQIKDTSLITGRDTTGKWHAPSYINEMKLNDDDTRPTSNDNNTPQKSLGYLSEAEILALHPVEPFANALYLDFNNGPICFNKAGDTIYFTRNRENKKQGLYNLEICRAVLKNGEWGQVKKLPFSKEGYDYFHPTLTADGSRLFFCSNESGGAGGTDIYSVPIEEGGIFSEMVNETAVNTAGNELFPAFNGDTLYFSSDGYAGLGGLDIYRSWREKGLPKQPQNLGYPLNSSYDDFGMVYADNGGAGLFTSNRLGSDDIYSFRPATPKLPTINQDSLDLIAKIIRETKEAEIKRERADSIARNQKLPIKDTIVTKEVLTTKQVEEKLKTQKLDDEDKIIQSEMDMLAKLVLFETAKDILLSESILILEEVKAYLDKHPGYLLMIEGHTDNRSGALYNYDLSNRRAASVRQYLVSRGIAESRLFSVGYGLNRPKTTNATPEGRKLNRRVEMKVVKSG